MPWDQVEETPAPVISEAEVQGDAGIVEAPLSQELFATDHALDAGTPADPPTATSSFTSSSGLSWEDILTAVAAMQTDPALAQSQSTAESEDVTAIDGRAGSASTSTPPADPSETAWLSLAPPPLESLASLASDSPPLSAPMPWEQIEVEDVTIPRQDPSRNSDQFLPMLGTALRMRPWSCLPRRTGAHRCRLCRFLRTRR